MTPARIVLALFACINIGRGAIHAFAPDGGAHSIAGLNLGDEAATILALFATIGLMQLTLGGFQLWAVLQRPDLVLVLLAFQTVQTVLGTWHLWFWRPLPVAVPGAMFNLVLIGVLLLTWGFTVTRKRKTP
jgi:hypothetical protein